MAGIGPGADASPTGRLCLLAGNLEQSALRETKFEVLAVARSKRPKFETSQFKSLRNYPKLLS